MSRSVGRSIIDAVEYEVYLTLEPDRAIDPETVTLFTDENHIAEKRLMMETHIAVGQQLQARVMAGTEGVRRALRAHEVQVASNEQLRGEIVRLNEMLRSLNVLLDIREQAFGRSEAAYDDLSGRYRRAARRVLTMLQQRNRYVLSLYHKLARAQYLLSSSRQQGAANGDWR